MISPARMERIWEKCPELRPEGLTRDGGYFGNEWSLAEWTRRTVGHGDSVKASLPERVAATMIRDACVLWAAKYRLEIWKKDYGYLVRGNTDDGLGLVGGWNSDPTEACLQGIERHLKLEPWEEPK